MHVVIAAVRRVPSQRTEVVLGAERDTRGRVRLQVGHVDQIRRLGVGQRHVVLGLPGWSGAPIEGNGRQGYRRARVAGVAAVAVQVLDIRKLRLQRVMVLIGKQAGGISDRDVCRIHPGHIHQLAQQGPHHLRRGIHVVEPADQVVCVGIDGPPAGDATHQVDLDANLLPRGVPDISLAAGAVEVPKKGIPGRNIGGLAAESPDGPGHHPIHYHLVGVSALPPTSIARSRPVGGRGIVHPYNASGVKSPGHTNRRVRGRRLRQHHTLRHRHQCDQACHHREHKARTGQRQARLPEETPGLAIRED